MFNRIKNHILPTLVNEFDIDKIYGEKDLINLYQSFQTRYQLDEYEYLLMLVLFGQYLNNIHTKA